MSRLRIFRQNQRNMLELVRYQKKELKQVAGAEEAIYTASDMIAMENANRRKLGVIGCFLLVKIECFCYDDQGRFFCHTVRPSVT